MAEINYGLPTAQPVTAVPADANQIDPATLAYLKQIGLDDATIANLDAATLRNMTRSAQVEAYGARQDAYNAALQAELQRSGELQRIGTTYVEANPEDYFNTFGTIPIQSFGESRYGVTEAGGVDTSKGAEGIKYLTPDATATYTLYSPRSGETLGTGVGAQGLLSLAKTASEQTASKDRLADWQLIKTPAEGGTPEVVGSNLYNSDLTTLGKIVATGLPIATAFIPGLNVIGSIAAGAGAGGLSAAMQDQNILKGALIGGATAGLTKGLKLDQALSKAFSPASTSAMPSIESALADVSRQLAETTFLTAPNVASAAAQAAASSAPGVLDAITVLGNPARYGSSFAPNLVRGTLGAALAAAKPGPVNYGDQVYDQPTDEIVVEGSKPIAPPATVPPFDFWDAMTLPAATTLAPNTSNITQPSTEKPAAPPSTLLNDIMKYYSIGSGVLDALGVGQGGGTSGTTTTYTPTLGAVPTLGRGAYQQYTGDYETYGQGPEWSFFSQPAAPAAPFTLLPPPTTTGA